MPFTSLGTLVSANSTSLLSEANIQITTAMYVVAQSSTCSWTTSDQTAKKNENKDEQRVDHSGRRAQKEPLYVIQNLI